jgi:hypothetical protein
VRQLFIALLLVSLKTTIYLFICLFIIDPQKSRHTEELTRFECWKKAKNPIVSEWGVLCSNERSLLSHNRRTIERDLSFCLCETVVIPCKFGARPKDTRSPAPLQSNNGGVTKVRLVNGVFVFHYALLSPIAHS